MSKYYYKRYRIKEDFDVQWTRNYKDRWWVNYNTTISDRTRTFNYMSSLSSYNNISRETLRWSGGSYTSVKSGFYSDEGSPNNIKSLDGTVWGRVVRSGYDEGRTSTSDDFLWIEGENYTASVTTKQVRGDYVDTIEASDGAYPNNGISGSYWYVKGEAVYVPPPTPSNSPPRISGNNLDLGDKSSDFDIDYRVYDDDGDRVTVDIFEDNVKVVNAKVVSLGTLYTYNVSLADFSLGEHEVRIVARDRIGATATRRYTFRKANRVPIIITDAESDLGNKNTPFTITYQVKDEDADTVNIVETLNGVEIARRNNAPQDEDIYLTIDREQINSLDFDVENTIVIKAEDNKGGVTFKRFYFKRNNAPPIISGQDGDLGEIVDALRHEYSVTDVEKDPIRLGVSLDGKVIKPKEDIIDSQNYTLTIDGITFFQVAPGVHNLKLEAEDDKGGVSERRLTFTRRVDKCGVQLKKPIETDAMAKNIMVTPSWLVAEGAVARIEACNNAFDDSPTWEDITQMAAEKRKFTFKNETKTADKYGVDVRLIIEREQATQYSYIYGFGGSIG